jgi:acetyl-CoA C-acetyltransferase
VQADDDVDGAAFSFNARQLVGPAAVAAAYAGMDLLEAGHEDLAPLLGVERMAQAKNVPAVFNSIVDPIYGRDTSLSTLSMCATRATLLMQRYGYTRELFAKVAERNFLHASRNPLAHIKKPHTTEEVLASRMLSWPMRQLDACPVSEGVCAIAVSRVSALGARPAPVAYVTGRATFSDTYNQGDRFNRPEGDLVDLLTLRAARALDCHRRVPRGGTRLLALRTSIREFRAHAAQSVVISCDDTAWRHGHHRAERS